MLFYTDGIIEAQNAEGEYFGLGRFTDFIIMHEGDGRTRRADCRTMPRTFWSNGSPSTPSSPCSPEVPSAAGIRGAGIWGRWCRRPAPGQREVRVRAGQGNHLPNPVLDGCRRVVKRPVAGFTLVHMRLLTAEQPRVTMPGRQLVLVSPLPVSGCGRWSFRSAEASRRARAGGEVPLSWAARAPVSDRHEIDQRPCGRRSRHPL
ncbi:hypothetical protein [Nonomuraea ferruginea]|uniref:Stage II sporulation protein E n=1 Tax=Nonomuraea ferruginea TaxID=46174 RepID=A0ABT4TB24_9ACTN|nr:hypothetical protein [Nonomuraea ferruginea]MDA0646693.1 hypothetical protein [Nonomuraea ferruginea]